MSVAEKVVRAGWSPAALRVLSVYARRAGGVNPLVEVNLEEEPTIPLHQYSAYGVSYQVPI